MRPGKSSVYFYLYKLFSQVDSANKHGILLEMVQVLTDLDLVISKSYISSDGGWFMDGNVFFVHYILPHLIISFRFDIKKRCVCMSHPHE